MEQKKYDWFEFGIYGLIKADEINKHLPELKRLGLKCTAVFFNKTREEINEYYSNL